MNTKVAIITGASVGLGAEFAKQIAQRFVIDEIWLIARREAAMKVVESSITNSSCRVIPMDLSKNESIEVLKNLFVQEKPDIQLLVNNAGLGKVGPFQGLSLEEQLPMLDVNMRALTAISYIALPYMKKSAGIIQVGSSIAWTPAPNFAIYSATKAYVLSFSQALGFELRKQGIHVITVCPGPVRTEFQKVANTNQYNQKNAIPVDTEVPLMAEASLVVKKALDDYESKKKISIYGFIVKVFVALVHYLPTEFSLRLMSMAKGKKVNV